MHVKTCGKLFQDEDNHIGKAPHVFEDLLRTAPESLKAEEVFNLNHPIYLKKQNKRIFHCIGKHLSISFVWHDEQYPSIFLIDEMDYFFFFNFFNKKINSCIPIP